ncbi:cell wall-binding repeat-containing protein [Peptacetobacter hiranonis]|uniref:cell wall-binding repeat-containing protein n=1 Tax=Peptacetobacter hiranonis TaxID=89152 RepID=UPI0022DF33F5|nr:cell wall-binding repeat-containing protein [Peptacetobacter hiranonis]
MNKKKLSVVMAGAMLATTAAPIMAATTTDASANELGLLIGKVRDILESKKFSSNTTRNTVSGTDLSGQSVYYLKINGEEAKAVSTATVKGGMDLQKALQAALGSLKPGATVEIWSRGYVTEGSGENEKVFATQLKTTYAETDMTTSGDIVTNLTKGLNGNKNILNGEVGTAVTAVPNQSVTIALNSDSLVSGDKIVLKPGSAILDFTKYIDASGNINPIDGTHPADAKDFAGFPVKTQAELEKTPTYVDITDTLDQTINITGTAPNTFKTSDLFNGVMLTEEGHDLLTKIEEVAPVAKASVITETPNVISEGQPKVVSNPESSTGSAAQGQAGKDGSKTPVPQTKVEGDQNQAGKEVVKSLDESKKKAAAATGTVAYTTVEGNRPISTGKYNLSKSSDGTYGFNIELTNTSTNTTTNYVVKGENKKDTETLLNWLFTQDPKVDILAGKDRYETAVKVAEEYIMNQPFSGKNPNVVIVNGNSLVDGLSASPLAAKLKAPMLLSKTDEVPKATLDYLKKLSENTTISNLKNITINLVGGKGVLSDNVERQLKDLGYTVKRYGGENREATSMKVANAIGNKDNAFVVGANGEADAMSIASVASSTKMSQTNNAIAPIIVSNFKGLSSNTLDFLDNAKTVTVLGGEAVVSNEEFDTIKEAVPTTAKVNRIAGANRQETNAKVISTYYAGNFGDGSDVLVAKDGQRNKMELVDALTVSNLAALKNAPIVLATDKLDKAQINTLELNAKQAKALYQVGNGVNLDVVKTLANLLGLQ